MSAPRTRSLADFLWLLVGPVVWLLHLVVLYGTEALICTPPVGSGRTMMWMGAAATIVALGALGMLAAVSIRRLQDAEEQADTAFLRKTTLLLALLSALGVIWSALPLALMPVCAAAGG